MNDRDALRYLERDIPPVIQDLKMIRDLVHDMDDEDYQRVLAPYSLILKHAIPSLEGMLEVVKWHLRVIRAVEGGGEDDSEEDVRDESP